MAQAARIEKVTEVSKMHALRVAVVKATTGQYGAMIAYAEGLNAYFGNFDWFNVTREDTSDAAKPVHTEKKALFAALKEANHSNPATIWARVRDYARKIKYPAQDDEGNGANANEGRSPLLRYQEELLKLYKFGQKQENMLPKVQTAHELVIKALVALGVDMNADKQAA